MGMEALLLSPQALAGAVKLYGLKAARLDIHPVSADLVLSISRKGKIFHITVPTQRTFTADEICTLLIHGKLPDPPEASGPDPVEIAAIAASPP